MHRVWAKQQVPVVTPGKGGTEVDGFPVFNSVREAIAQTGYDERIYIRGDQNADYGTIMRVMGRINQAGFKNLGLVTLQEQDS